MVRGEEGPDLKEGEGAVRMRVIVGDGRRSGGKKIERGEKRVANVSQLETKWVDYRVNER